MIRHSEKSLWVHVKTGNQETSWKAMRVIQREKVTQGQLVTVQVETSPES